MHKWFTRALLALVIAASAGTSFGAAVHKANLPMTNESMLAAAKTEGSVTWYVSQGEAIGRRLSQAFEAKHGIKVAFLVLQSAKMLQRYSAEVQAGKVAADVLTATVTEQQVAELIKIGGVEPIGDFDLPVLKSEFPAAFNKGPTRLVSATPWVLGYNTERIKAADVPKEWNEVLKPRWKDKTFVPDPASSETYIAFWYAMMQHYGPGFLNGVRAQNPRMQGNAIPAIQAIAAGEGDFVFPTQIGLVLPLKARGAPIEFVILKGPSTGNFSQVIMTRADKSPHPNAARLFVNFLLSKEGSAVYNSDPGQYGSHNIHELPAGFSPGTPESMAHKDEILKLLGK